MAMSSGASDPAVPDPIVHRYMRDRDMSITRPRATRGLATRGTIVLGRAGEHTSGVTCVAFDHLREDRCLSGSHDMTCKVWDIATGRVLATFAGHDKPVWSVAYQQARMPGKSTSSRVLASCSGDCTVKVWCMHTTELSDDGPAAGQVQKAVGAANVTTSAASGSSATTRLLVTLAGHLKLVRCVVFHPTKATVLASASSDGTARVWDFATSSCVAELRGHTAVVTSVAFHPANPHLLATSSADETAKLWNYTSGDCASELAGHVSTITAVAFHPRHDLSTIATASTDKTVRIIDTASMACTSLLQGHSDYVMASRRLVASPHLSLHRRALCCVPSTVARWRALPLNAPSVLAAHLARRFACGLCMHACVRISRRHCCRSSTSK